MASDRLAKLHMLPCVACVVLDEDQDSITEGHHMKHLPDGTKLKAGHKKADDEYSLPLCQNKHHWNNVFNKGKWCLETFEAHVGKTEPELWAITNEMLENL